MTSPAQDQDPATTFDVDPRHHIAVLEQQRNRALDEAAMWRAAATQERMNKLDLEERISKMEILVKSLGGDTEAPAPDTA